MNEVRLPPLCLLDWGIGGFGVARAILTATATATATAAAHANASGIEVGYFSDSGTAPYGTLSAEALRARIELVAHALAARGVRHLVLACNAASTVATNARWPAELDVTDVISHGVALVKTARVREVGIVGGARTIRSGCHARALRALGIRVRPRIAQPLSAFVERGILHGAEVEAEVARIVAPLRRGGVPALLLACTHYPALAPLFRAALPDTRLLDPADAIAKAVVRITSTLPVLRGGSRIVAMTSGSPEAMRAAARRAFAIDPGAVVRWSP